ncbi:MAG: phenylalanine--tRNA ligase subunit beta [Caldimicrobium sp.]|nr:phenylalanine--tRNA ligase subunit beta [Caldimicrobium sp.]MCX7874442.1 phenylalanine--tRNA ligase subunit beta [Caldimicrobium sp.]MDW8094955.1 phenylalanine--tRNA ligase subunit beta [Caldimicrobium sp.]
MRVPLSWLSEFVELKATPEEIAEILTLSGHEVEEIFDPYERLGEIITVKVLEVSAPEELRESCLCKVSDGKEVFTVLTTAKDQITVGQVLAFAKPGSLTFNHLRIDYKTVKGYRSEGCLLSPFEAGISPEKNRLLILDERVEVGRSLYEVLGIKEPVLEIAITPNRGDLLSIYGIARELHLITGWELKPLLIEEKKEAHFTFPGKIVIEDEERCYRYAGRLIKGVKVEESPFFILKRLFLCGQRPINNIVDITNYVLLELGQPLHAFDWHKIRGGEILVRRAKKGERLLFLDGREVELHPEDLVIADRERPLVLAGILGGEESAVEEHTGDVFLESAWFNSKSIRLSTQRHRITTESSYRFERKIDPEGVLLALKRATQLIGEHLCFQAISEIVDVYPKPYEAPSIYISLKQIRKLLGFEVALEKVENILQRLGEVRTKGEIYEVKPPSFRQDLTLPEDIVEEIARLYGYEQIPMTFPKAELFSSKPRPDLLFSKKIKEIFRSFGFFEVITYSFINPESLSKLNLNPQDRRLKAIALDNPISSALSIMRTTLLPGLLETARFNLHREVDNLRIFEVGKIFYPAEGLAEERETLGFLLMGRKGEALWDGKEAKHDLFDLKGILEELALILRVPLKFKPFSKEPFLKTGLSFDIYLEDQKIGFAGAMKKIIVEEFELKEPLWIAELDLDALLVCYLKTQTTLTPRKPPKFPSTFRDISCILDKFIYYETIRDFLFQLQIPYLERVEIVALYEGEPIPQGKKSISLRFWYRAEDRTLKDEEVEKIHEEVAKRLFEHFRAKPR